MKKFCEKGYCERAELVAALQELVTAIDRKAAARANPASYYSPRMGEAIARAKTLIGAA